MADEEPTTPESNDDAQTHITRLNEENAARRVENNQLKEQVAELKAIQEKFEAMQAEKMSEQEKATARLNELQADIEEAKREAARLTTRNSVNEALLRHGVDPVHHELLHAAAASLPLDDEEALAERLQPYQTPKTTEPKKAPPVAPANGDGVEVDFDAYLAMSEEQRIAYLEKNNGRVPWASESL